MKVLLISHNPFSTYDSMGKTFCTLFSSFKKEELCQLYIYPTIPNIDLCNSSYRITDKDVLKGLFKFDVQGREIRKEEINADCRLFEKNKDESFYRNPKNHNAVRKIARDLMWTLSPWFNKRLKKWLNQQDITHIFIATGGYKFIYDIALKCAKYLNVPIVTYVCDEHFFVKPRCAFIDKFQQFLLNSKIKYLLSKTSLMITISDELKNAYESFFNIKAETVMTAASFKIQNKPAPWETFRAFTYMGNVRYNRYISLQNLGLALDEINNECGTNYQINIYTEENDAKILSELSKANSIKLMGFVSGEEFKKVFFSAQTLLHVEAFDEKSIDYVKNSISTKIADSLASGIPLLAYGPSSIASVKHLKRNNCAYCIENKESLKVGLLHYLNMPIEERSQIVTNALATAHKYHDLETVGKTVYNLMDGVDK